MRHRHIQIERGFAVGRIESAILRGMLVDIHLHVKSFFDLGYGSVDIDKQAIWRRVSDSKTIAFGELNYGLIIVDGWSEGFGELRYAEKMTVIGAGRIIEPV